MTRRKTTAAEQAETPEVPHRAADELLAWVRNLKEETMKLETIAQRINMDGTGAQ